MVSFSKFFKNISFQRPQDIAHYSTNSTMLYCNMSLPVKTATCIELTHTHRDLGVGVANSTTEVSLLYCSIPMKSFKNQKNYEWPCASSTNAL